VSEPGDIKKQNIFTCLLISTRSNGLNREWLRLTFGDKYGIFVQAWTAFGIDAVIWMSGVENAVMMAMADPESFAGWWTIFLKPTSSGQNCH